VLDLLAAIHDEPTGVCVAAERTFLSALGGGCSLPIAAYATLEGQEIHLAGLVAGEDGRQVIRVSGKGRHPHELGAGLARQARDQGAEALLL
jgi:hydroxymethylbilane synthase